MHYTFRNTFVEATQRILFSHPNRFMRKALSLAIIVTVLGVFAYFTKPSKDACISKAREEFRNKQLGYTLQNLPAGVNREVFQKLAEKAFLLSIQVEDKFFYRAIYQVDNKKNKKSIGWGAFSWVSVDLS